MPVIIHNYQVCTRTPPGQMGRNRYRPGGFDGAEAAVKSGKEQLNQNPQAP
jgi:hypothetical protein